MPRFPGGHVGGAGAEAKSDGRHAVFRALISSAGLLEAGRPGGGMNTSRLQTGHVLRKQLSYPETAFPVITSILPGARGLGELPINLKALLWNNNASLPPDSPV